MRRLLLVPLAAAVILAPAACADLQQPTAPRAASAIATGLRSGDSITVMTRNMYLGANIDPLIAPGADPAAVLPVALAQLNHTDFPARAYYMALEIATLHPQAVGLQEVSHYIFDTVGGVQTMDFLDILQYWLTIQGAQYDVAVRQNNVTLYIPLGGAGGLNSVTYTDGDAILVRHDVAHSAAAAAHFPTQVELTVAGTTFDNLRGWTAVTVGTDRSAYRFVNVHAEIQLFAAVQEQQARELVAMLQDEPLPIVLVGDFNSAANPSAPTDSKTGTYHILREAGFADLALRQAQSAKLVTCCHDASLDEAVSTQNQRLDLVLARFGPAGFGGQAEVDVVAGERFLDAHGYYLWPSDHAAVYATLWPAPALAVH